MNRLGAEQQLHSQANTTNYVELIMPNANLTLERAQELVNDAEQMALALIMLQNQSLKPEEFHSLCLPLLEKLNSDLQEASSLILVNRYQGGMGEAPMLGALSPFPC